MRPNTSSNAFGETSMIQSIAARPFLVRLALVIIASICFWHGAPLSLIIGGVCLGVAISKTRE
jgi:hypothetical protein